MSKLATMGRPGNQSRVLRPLRYGLPHRPPRKASILVATIICANLLLCAWIWVVLLTKGYLAIGGIPTPIIVSFLQDEKARNAYFQGDKTKFYARLQDLYIEDKMKAYYRPQIPNEAKLDQYTHQILYDRTGYVGESYRVNQGILVLQKKAK